MKKTVDILLLIAAVLSITLLMWPFAEWNNVMSVVLRVIPSLATQLLFCRVCKSKRIQAVPVFLSGAIAVWGIYLFLTSPHWSNATVVDLIADYVSPFISCEAVLLARLLKK